MIARRSACSTRVPSKFIPTSQDAIPVIETNSPSATTSGWTAETPTTAAVSPRPATREANTTVRSAPNLEITEPASGRATIEPSEPTRRISPISRGLSESSSRIVGNRETQFANVKPLRAKIAKTAPAARRARAGGKTVWVPEVMVARALVVVVVAGSPSGTIV